MELTVDGYVYEWQRRGGVSRIFSEILPRLCDLEPQLAVKLITQKPLVQGLPIHRRLIHRKVPDVERYVRPRRLWQGLTPLLQRWLRKRYVGTGQGTIWHSTYFTEPGVWQGKRVVTVYDLAHEKFSQLFDKADDEKQRNRMRHSVENADRVIAISEASRRDVEKYYGVAPEKIRVVSPACSSNFRVSSKANPATKPFLLYVGDRNHYKNFRVLLEAYGRWKRRNDYDLVVVGGGDWLPGEIAEIERPGVKSSVRRMTGLDDDQLALLYNQALAFVYPSLYEGFGIPLLEAFSCGCLVIASRIPTTLEVGGQCPIYFEAEQVDSLIAAFELAVVEPQDSPRRAEGFRQVARYSWDKAARATLAIYRELDHEMRAA